MAKPIPVQIAVDTDPSEYPEFANQGLVNAYAVPGSKGGSKPAIVHFSPGLTEADDTSDFICRGGIGIIGATATDDVAYFGFEGSVQKLTWDGSTYTLADLGIIPGRGQLQFARNAADPFQVGVINDAGRFYIIEDDVISIGPASGLPTVWNSITFAGNHIILGLDDGRMFATNLLNMTAIDGLDFATAEGDPDGLVAVQGLGQTLFAFGRKTTEAWTANGASVGFPFSPLGGTIGKFGCIAKHSIRESDGTLMWITNDGFVAAMVGYQAQRISNKAVELAIAGVSDPENIVGYSYGDAGTSVYGISHDSFTWERNNQSGLWSERQSHNQTRWRATGVVSVFGKVLCGDVIAGKIWEIDRDSRTEGTDPVTVEIRSEPLDPQGQQVGVSRIEIDAVTGRAAISGTTPQTDPVVMMDWTDNGHTPWSDERQLSLGAIGERGLQMASNRLGMIRKGKRRTFRLRCSDPVVTGFIGAIRVFV